MPTFKLHLLHHDVVDLDEANLPFTDLHHACLGTWPIFDDGDNVLGLVERAESRSLPLPRAEELSCALREWHGTQEPFRTTSGRQ